MVTSSLDGAELKSYGQREEIGIFLKICANTLFLAKNLKSEGLNSLSRYNPSNVFCTLTLFDMGGGGMMASPKCF